MNEKDDRARQEIQRKQRREQEAREKARARVDKGRWFHMGMAATRGETTANGWRTELPVRTLEGMRRYDTARTVDPTDKRFTEYKSGRTPERETLEQLAKDRDRIQNDGWSGTWVTVEGVKMPWRVSRELARLQREFPDRFDVVYVTKEQAERAILKGKELERQQLELFSGDKLRAQQERVRQQERARAIERAKEAQRARDAAEAAKKEQVREITDLHRLAFPTPGDRSRDPLGREPHERNPRGRERGRDERGRDERGRER